MNYLSYTATLPNGDFICESNLSPYGCRVPGRDVAPSFESATMRVRSEIARLQAEGWNVEFTESPLTEDDLECLREFRAI
jgi:hypothetical protein